MASNKNLLDGNGEFLGEQKILYYIKQTLSYSYKKISKRKDAKSI